MSSDSFSDSYDDDFACDLLTRQEKPTIKILLYTDDPQEVQDTEDVTESAFGVGKLKKFMTRHPPACAQLDAKLESRNGKDEAAFGIRKLDLEFLNQYDEVWFFGIHQVDKKKPKLGIGGGNPDSELKDEEVAALTKWMKAGGVLMSGDHANPDPRCEITPPPNNDMERFCPEGVDRETFLVLGRALGHRVPRAGELRKWKGPPTRCQEDNFNTQELSGGVTNYENGGLQEDSTPQNIVLVYFNEWGEPDTAGRPHRLFIDKTGRQIKVFPDHMHEGRITLPSKPDYAVWPEKGGVRPLPRVAAHGIDKSNGERHPLVAVYDGDPVGCGRIVADSTWHHYFNVNLYGFDCEGDTVRDQLGQFYVNLAVWLSSLKTRRKMASYMFGWLARHPLMLEELGAGILNVGRMALHILQRESSPCEVSELLLAATPPELRPAGEGFEFPSKSPALDSLPTKELILGAVLQEYHQELSADAADASGAGAGRTLAEVLRSGFARAFELQATMLSEAAAVSRERLRLLRRSRGTPESAPAEKPKE